MTLDLRTTACTKKIPLCYASERQFLLTNSQTTLYNQIVLINFLSIQGDRPQACVQRYMCDVCIFFLPMSLED